MNNSTNIKDKTKLVTRMRSLTNSDINKDVNNLRALASFGAMKPSAKRTCDVNSTNGSDQSNKPFPAGFGNPTRAVRESAFRSAPVVNVGDGFKFTACFAGAIDRDQDGKEDNYRGKPGSTSLGPVSVLYVNNDNHQHRRDDNDNEWQQHSVSTLRSNEQLDDIAASSYLSNERFRSAHCNWVLDEHTKDEVPDEHILFMEYAERVAANNSNKLKWREQPPVRQSVPLPQPTQPSTYSCGSVLATYNLLGSHRPYSNGEPTPPSPRHLRAGNSITLGNMATTSPPPPTSSSSFPPPHSPNANPSSPILRTQKPPSTEHPTPEFNMAITSMPLQDPISLKKKQHHLQYRYPSQKDEVSEVSSHQPDYPISSLDLMCPSTDRPYVPPPSQYDTESVISSSAVKRTMTSSFFSEIDKERHAKQHLQQVRSLPIPQHGGPDVKKMSQSANFFKSRLENSTCHEKEAMAHAYSLLPKRIHVSNSTKSSSIHRNQN